MVAVGCLLTLACAQRIAAADEVIDRVVAVVAGEVIMQSDVNAVGTLGLSSMPRGVSSGDAVSQLIDRTLVLSEIERYSPPEPQPSAIENGVRAVRDRFPTREAFEQALARVGFTERRLQQTIRQDLRISSYLEQRFTTPVPTDDEISAYYQTHRDEFVARGRQSLSEARELVEQAVRERRHDALVADWVAGLRRRASIMRAGMASGG